MRNKNAGQKPATAVPSRPAQDCPSTVHVPSRPVARPASRKSEAIIKEVSGRRRTAMKVLANR